MKNVRQLN